MNAGEVARRLRLEKRANLDEARALIGLALNALDEAERHDFAASVCEDLEAIPDTSPESGEDDPQGAGRGDVA
jgi:cob(I)alamin adenosyltransferase